MECTFAIGVPLLTTIAWFTLKYDELKVTTFARAGVYEIWLMSKSNGFLPGAYALANGTYTHLTAERWKPSCLATAYTTADSKPLPFDGSLSFHCEPFGAPPAYQGVYAGLSVPTVSVPSLTTRSAHPVGSAGAVACPNASVAESAATSATTTSAAIRAIGGDKLARCRSAATTCESRIRTSSSSPTAASPRAISLRTTSTWRRAFSRTCGAGRSI